jgi:hypothetical protein
VLIQRFTAFSVYVSPPERPGGRGQPWSDDEIAATVDDYFEMLRAELEGRPYVKAEHFRAIGKRLNGRTKGAIEQKHMNISAILQELGRPFINGYKPLKNYQQALKLAVESQVTRAPWLPQTDVRGTKIR